MCACVFNVSLIERTRKDIQMCTTGKCARRDFPKLYKENAHAQILMQPADPWQPAVCVCVCVLLSSNRQFQS